MSDMSKSLQDENIRENYSFIKDLFQKVKDLEHRLIYLEELGIEKHIADHNRDNHQREMALDFADASGLSRAGIEY